MSPKTIASPAKRRTYFWTEFVKKNLEKLKVHADIIIDTSGKSVHNLSREIRRIMSDEESQTLRVTVMSLFKHVFLLTRIGLWICFWRILIKKELRHLTGKDKLVSDYVLSQEGKVKGLTIHICKL